MSNIQVQPGHLVELRTSPMDWRDYVADVPIHNGELLELWTATGWRLVRYESAGWTNAFQVFDDDTTQTLARAWLRVRWPTRT
jgi:hypothetical protein